MNLKAFLIGLGLIGCACNAAMGDNDSSAKECYLFIGDSVTDGGWGRSGGSVVPSAQRNHSDLNHIYGHSYMMLCAARMMADNPERDWTWLNRGISCDNLHGLADRWETDVINENPTLLSVLIGTNDVADFIRSGAAGDFNVEEWIALYRDLLSQARAHNLDLKIVLISPFVCKGRMIKEENLSRQQRYIDLCAKAIEALASEFDAIYVDANSLFHNLTDGNPNYSRWLWDGVHPTAAGHQRLADLWILSQSEKGIQ